jgi:alginate O-acetyltransferase complex protein AlgI
VRARWAAAAVWGILLLLFALKFAPLAQGLAFWLRWVMQQDLKQALPTDVRWLGFSYLAFRLVHALRERTTNPRWQAVSLAEFLSFALFLPAWVAGPIDKLPRFVQDLRQPSQPRWANAVLACQRLTVGIAKKFGFAALLSLFALNPQLAEQVRQPAWLWVMLLGYGLYLYCDFSGYTDIALGLALLFDLRLPENFGSNQQQPYRQGNLTQFWNQWHISLAQWFRAYYFNPLSKQLRQLRLSPAVMIAIAQISTMLLIGIWHGVTWNFAIWGLWHGVALFCHNRWVDYCRQKQLTLGQPGWQQRAIGGTFTLLTFVYVNLGWVWFALPSFSQSWLVLRRLFGLG